jgi:hypothetical protein
MFLLILFQRSMQCYKSCSRILNSTSMKSKHKVMTEVSYFMLSSYKVKLVLFADYSLLLKALSSLF